LVKPKPMKRYFLLLPFILFISQLSAQPVINQSDMPVAGDTITMNIASAVTGVDYTTTGMNYTWDLSSLTPTSQRIDTFKALTTYPLQYIAMFNGASFGVTAPDMVPVNTFITLSITDVNNFFQASSAAYSQFGYGANFNGFALPVKFDNPDVVLKFPLTMGKKDSCDFAYYLDMTSQLGMYYGESKHRVNEVDAWGKIITPVDTFIAMRVLSKIRVHDTIHLDTLGGIGLPINYTITEYKWYAKSMKVPVMKVSVQTGGTAPGTTAEWPSLLNPHTGISEFDASLAFVDIYPNPSDENTRIYFSLVDPSSVEIRITDILGRNITCLPGKKYPEGFSSVPLDLRELNLKKGLYFVRVTAGEDTKVIKMQLQ
jgi:hypothetical protein